MAGKGEPGRRRWLGARSERAAEQFLARLGMRILARNVHYRDGEIDLVALDGSEVVFAEVRSTESEDLERVSQSVGASKQRKLTQAALAWLTENGLLEHSARFDVVLISWPPGQREPLIEHIPHAFEASGQGQMFT
jgi:putative endonuclease